MRAVRICSDSTKHTLSASFGAGYSTGLRDEISLLFGQGNVTEKSMALTVLATVEQYFVP